MSDAAAAAAPPKSSKTLVIVLAAALVLVLAGGGAGAWFFLGRGAEAAPAKKHAAAPLFTTLEPFTVNLQDPRGERFAQIGVTLQFDDPATEKLIKDRLPAVRNEILLLISSKQIEDLLSNEGKRKLADEIRVRSARAMGVAVADPDDGKEEGRGKRDHGRGDGPANPIQGVLYSQFIVQ